MKLQTLSIASTALDLVVRGWKSSGRKSLDCDILFSNKNKPNKEAAW